MLNDAVPGFHKQICRSAPGRTALPPEVKGTSILEPDTRKKGTKKKGGPEGPPFPHQTRKR